jgi:hypothetical protein
MKFNVEAFYKTCHAFKVEKFNDQFKRRPNYISERNPCKEIHEI